MPSIPRLRIAQSDVNSSCHRTKKMNFSPWQSATAGSACERCDGGEPAALIVLCDHCGRAWHTTCRQPPLDEVPQGEEPWLCAGCSAAGSPVLQHVLFDKRSRTYSAQQLLRLDPRTLQVAQDAPDTCVTLASGIPSAREAAVVRDLGALWALHRGHPALAEPRLNFPEGPEGWGGVDASLQPLWDCSSLREWFDVVRGWQEAGRLGQLVATVGGLHASQPAALKVAGGGEPDIVANEDGRWLVNVYLPLAFAAQDGVGMRVIGVKAPARKEMLSSYGGYSSKAEAQIAGDLCSHWAISQLPDDAQYNAHFCVPLATWSALAREEAATMRTLGTFEDVRRELRAFHSGGVLSQLALRLGLVPSPWSPVPPQAAQTSADVFANLNDMAEVLEAALPGELDTVEAFEEMFRSTMSPAQQRYVFRRIQRRAHEPHAVRKLVRDELNMRG